MQWTQSLVLLYDFLISGCDFEKSISREKTDYSGSVHLEYRQWHCMVQCLAISICNGKFTMEACFSFLETASELNNHLRGQTAGEIMSSL